MRHLDNYVGPNPPDSFIETLKRRQGTFGASRFPVWRLVWSENVMEKIGGEWQDWPDGVAISDRGAVSNILDQDGRPQPMATPIRVVTEVREIPAYSHLDRPGWMLERWFPPSMFGGEAAWYAEVVPGTTVHRLGPYPIDGRYVQRGGPFPQIPGMDFIEDFISGDQKAVETVMSMDPQAYIKQQVYKAQEKDRKLSEHAIAENTARLIDSMSFLDSTSLSAGALRNKMAEKSGIRSHMGN
jgi:hypothetical protein